MGFRGVRGVEGYRAELCISWVGWVMLCGIVVGGWVATEVMGLGNTHCDDHDGLTTEKSNPVRDGWRLMAWVCTNLWEIRGLVASVLLHHFQVQHIRWDGRQFFLRHMLGFAIAPAAGRRCVFGAIRAAERQHLAGRQNGWLGWQFCLHLLCRRFICPGTDQ